MLDDIGTIPEILAQIQDYMENTPVWLITPALQLFTPCTAVHGAPSSKPLV